MEHKIEQSKKRGSTHAVILSRGIPIRIVPVDTKSRIARFEAIAFSSGVASYPAPALIEKTFEKIRQAGHDGRIRVYRT